MSHETATEWMRELVDAQSFERSEPSRQITASDVDAWFREAWSGLKIYPRRSASYRVAIMVQVIADRTKARSKSSNFIDVYADRRKEHIEACKRARSLKRVLHPFTQKLQVEFQRLKEVATNVNKVFPGLEDQLLAAEAANASIDRFLDLPILFDGPDHIDPILVIADLAKKAWQDLWESGSDGEKRKVGFGVMPADPLAGC